MQVQTNAKLPQSSLNKNESQGFSLKGLLLRILIYSGVLVNLLLPLYDFKPNGFPVGYWIRAKLGESINAPVIEGINDAGGLNNINALNRAQEAYFKKTGYFSDSIEKLGVPIRDTERYSYRILSSMSGDNDFLPMTIKSNPGEYGMSHRRSVFLIAIAKYPLDKSYLGKVKTIQEIRNGKEPSEYKSVASLQSQVCEIDSRTLVPDPSCNLTPVTNYY